MAYLYIKEPWKLVSDLMPMDPPPTLFMDPSQISHYASRLAKTFTIDALVRHALQIHGLWQNTCSLGVDNDTLWVVIDTLWEVYIKALTRSTRLQQPGPSDS